MVIAGVATSFDWRIGYHRDVIPTLVATGMEERDTLE
jgi:hypothetical protein